jgi:ATP/maltotriose-dependent transcriptional regulator MalT
LTSPNQIACEIEALRGRIDEARKALTLIARSESSADVQRQAMYKANASALRFAEQRYEEALTDGEHAFEARRTLWSHHVSVKTGFVYAAEAAFALGNPEKVEELVAQVESLRPGELQPFLRAHAARFRARLSVLRGAADSADHGFRQAESIFREFGIPFWLAVTQLDHAEWLALGEGPEEGEPLLAEARETFDRLGAKPWLERLERVAVGGPQTTMVP